MKNHPDLEFNFPVSRPQNAFGHAPDDHTPGPVGGVPTSNDDDTSANTLAGGNYRHAPEIIACGSELSVEEQARIFALLNGDEDTEIN